MSDGLSEYFANLLTKWLSTKGGWISLLIIIGVFALRFLFSAIFHKKEEEDDEE